MRIKFGTEGWRGVIADDFTVENVKVVSAATAKYLLDADPPGDGVVVGHDCRMMSELFARTCATVLNSFGFGVVLNDRPTSSPALSWAIVARKCKGACVFTASHNPGIFHGLKFKPHYGGAALTEITNAIEKLLHKGEVTGNGSGKTVLADFVPDYFRRLKEFVDIERLQASGLPLAFDAMYGAGAGYLPGILPKMDIKSIRQERNPLFPGIQPEPMAEMLDALVEATEGRALGIAFDGDADRLGAIDEKGSFVDSHRIFAIVYKHLVERRGMSGEVVKTLTTTRLIDKLAAKYGVKCHVTPVGFKHIAELMLNGGVLMGGEESGGIGVSAHLPERDAMLIALLLIEAVVVSGRTLSGLVDELFEEFGPHWYHRIDAQFKRQHMSALQRVVATIDPKEVAGYGVTNPDRMDGSLFNLENGRFVMLRASGTEPVVRIYAEAESPDVAAALAGAGEALLRRALAEHGSR
jgi:phosphomannomutase